MTTPATLFAPGSQPAGRRPAPGRLALVQAFVNSHFDLEHHHGADRLASSGAAADWLIERGLSARGVHVEDADRRRAVVIREGLRALLAQHNGARAQPGAITDLRAAAAGLQSGIAVDENGSTRAVAATDDLVGALGLILALVGESQAAGTWTRLKACPGDHCGWAFYDHSRNQAGTWCSMAVCGGREKARAYRRRTR